MYCIYNQPSSSGRSAEVLGGAKSFVGFGSQTGFNVVPAASQSLVEDDSQLTPILRVTLRKMSKKDSVTKLKVSSCSLSLFSRIDEIVYPV